ncbi:L-seryl-tRNA(Sec) selenium transferase [Candidatus Roseilinea sp. NK_OTU-006]|uniref:L-seryl-tRNA(Sec) selenium transferase n=1 Tax=Candidatus Roseilinea sp. NK_OTU-006 TaxID=2704250 RepID=UPI0026C56670|nr:L-seryl-tRNA(Sec) selenium transferase [Candidatus Roseilinea sp. NK_OTU-006]
MALNDKLRQLPSVSELLAQANGLVEAEGHARVVHALREVLDRARRAIHNGAPPPSRDELIATARALLQSLSLERLPTVVNATGVIIHTNLGRAPLSRSAQEAMMKVGRDYSPLEFDMTIGERGRRGEAVEQLLCQLTGAEAALVVNNCAAATVLMLATVAAGKGVVISRGQLVEIGGGFRIPEIMAQSGARLIEVGTTNRTRLSDYEQAIREAEGHAPGVGAILHVHSSNFLMIGFVEAAPIADLVRLGEQFSVPVLDDLGSGALVDTSQFGLRREPMPQDSLRAGVAMVTFSGDKLLGGPQAGIMLGQREWIERCRRHPLARAFRADKFTLAGLSATLLHYARGEAHREVPVIRMLAMSKADITRRATQMAAQIAGWLRENGLRAELVDGVSTVGGGALPGETLPTTLIALASNARSPGEILAALRARGVIARISNDRVMLDLRTVLDDDELARRLCST